MYTAASCTAEFLRIVYISVLFLTETCFLKYNSVCSTEYMQKIIHQEILDLSSFYPKEYAEICDIVNSIFDALWMHPAGYEMTVIGQFYHFFGIVFGKHYYLKRYQNFGATTAHPASSNRYSTLSRHNYASPLTLQQLSSSVSMSPKYFDRFFSGNARHQTPMDYLNHQRGIERSLVPAFDYG